MHDQNTRKDVTSLTGLRGVAALYVVTHHYFGRVAFSNIASIFFMHGYLAVDLFFVLSGFVMALNYQHMFMHGFSTSAYFKFMGRRVARIYPIYFISTLAGLSIILLGWNGNISANVSSDSAWAFKLLLNLLLIQSWGLTGSINDPTWSLSAEWAAYVLFPALLIPCLFGRAAFAWLVAFLSFGLLIFLCLIPLAHLHRWSLDISSHHFALPVLRCLPEFSLGILAFRLSSTPFGRHLRADRFISIAICVAIFVLLFVPKSDLFVVFLFPLLVVTLASGSTHIPGRLLSSAPADLLGKLSYSIYLIHTLLGVFIPLADQKLSSLGVRHGHAVSTFSALTLTFIFAYLSYTYIEVPGREWFRSIFEGRTKNPKKAVIE